ncbi:HRDC domain-containing protein [Oleisolibacter albus]|uniref:HRDC domain-containing protein n=1 Tax=Oleisolibacter albus TaxID=2171757 RepID=UPI000DF477CD|nr:HRDC domain-containing protein [Oleisolibacter albus]
MNLEIRTFAIRDAAADEDEARLASFLRTVEVERIDTAYADAGWRVLVHFRDLRRKEERAQIEQAISDAINAWRAEMARNEGIEKDQVLPQGVVSEIARYAPTTEIELAVIASAAGINVGERGADIVRVVRQTMEDLTD